MGRLSGHTMIMVTRFDGSRMMLNDEHIERIDITPDTVITFTNGARYLVRESVEEILTEVTEFRAKIVAVGHEIAINGESNSAKSAQRLRVVPGTSVADIPAPSGGD